MTSRSFSAKPNMYERDCKLLTASQICITEIAKKYCPHIISKCGFIFYDSNHRDWPHKDKGFKTSQPRPYLISVWKTKRGSGGQL